MAKKSGASPVTTSAPALTEELTSALGTDQFFLVYQPTIDLKTNGFAGVEALMRWRHPERGVLGPETFLAELENSGQILPVGRWVLATACSQGAEWYARGFRFAVSVNVSVKQLADDEFVRDVTNALSSTQLDPALLVLEFAQETLTSDEEVSERRLNQLKSHGVRLAIDDFVPEHAPLINLERFPVDMVKLDRAFIAGIMKSAEATELVHALVSIAKAHNLQIVASGIESAEQRRQLQYEEVNIGQGFHFSQPAEVPEIDRFLEDFAIFSGRPL